jgi:endonuclease III-like uncharacterized protein
MGYYIDLEKISIDDYKEILRTADLLPSHMILTKNIDEMFNLLKKRKIENLGELRTALRSKNILQDFSKHSGISEDYLKILIRNVNGYRQKPNRIKDFPGISENVILKLESLGIKNTLQLFDKILTPQSRKELSSQTGISEREILRLAKLSDLCRIRWVNHTFAYVLLETGYDSDDKVADADYQELYEKVKKLNEEREIYKGNIGVNDMKRCVNAAKELTFDVEY